MSAIPVLSNPPEEYNQAYMRSLVANLNVAFVQLTARQLLECERINVSRLPTASTGLRSGDLWNDNGTVRVVT